MAWPRSATMTDRSSFFKGFRILAVSVTLVLCTGCSLHHQWGPLSDWTKQYHSKLTDRYQLFADHALVAGKRPTAVEMYQNALNEARSAGLSTIETLQCEKDLAGALLVRGRFKESLKYFEQALKTLERSKYNAPDLKAKLTAGKGFALLFLGNKQESRKHFKSAIELYKGKKQENDLYDLPIDLCVRCCTAGLKLADSDEPWHKQQVPSVCPTFPTRMLPTRTAHGAEDPAVHTRWELLMARAKMHDTRGEIDLANKYYSEALSFLTSRGVKDLRLTTTYRALSFLYATRMNWPQADYYTTQEMNHLIEQFGDRDLAMAGILSRQGMIKMRLGKGEEALRVLIEAKDIAESDNQEDELDAIVLRSLGLALLELKRVDEARDHLKKAVAIFEKSKGRFLDRLSTAYVGLCECELFEGNLDAAEAYLSKANEILKSTEYLGPKHKVKRLLTKIRMIRDQSRNAHANLKGHSFNGQSGEGKGMLEQAQELHRTLALPKETFMKMEKEMSGQTSK